MVDAELDKDNEVVVDDGVFAVGPAADAGAAAGLVGVFATTVELVIAILDGVDVVIGELGALVVEAVMVRKNLLKRRSVDLVCHGLAIDWIADPSVLDLEGTVGIDVEIVTARLLNQSLLRVVACAVGVEFGARHWEGFVVDEAVAVAVEHGVYAQGEDVLVVGGEDAWVDDGAPGDFQAFVDGLGAEDAGGADFVGPFASLVEDVGEDVLVVGNRDAVDVSKHSAASKYLYCTYMLCRTSSRCLTTAALPVR